MLVAKDNWDDVYRRSFIITATTGGKRSEDGDYASLSTIWRSPLFGKPFSSRGGRTIRGGKHTKEKKDKKPPLDEGATMED